MSHAAQSRPPLVLVVDDEEWSVRAIESILEPNGYHVRRAHTAADGLDRARAQPPDLILIDVSLPDRSGLDLCREFRADPRIGRRTPILVTTATPATRLLRLEALRAGAWELLPLPVDSEQLLAKLSNYVAAKRDHGGGGGDDVLGGVGALGEGASSGGAVGVHPDT